MLWEVLILSNALMKWRKNSSLLEPLTKLLAEGTRNGEGIRLENEKLVVPGVVAEELSPSTMFLREQINRGCLTSDFPKWD